MGKGIKSYLEERKINGGKIVGYSYPAKATTLCNFFKIGDLFDYVIEDSAFKINLFTPQFHIPINSGEFFERYNPDTVVILAWNFESMIRKNNSWFKGEWLIPLPEMKIY